MLPSGRQTQGQQGAVLLSIKVAKTVDLQEAQQMVAGLVRMAVVPGI